MQIFVNLIGLNLRRASHKTAGIIIIIIIV